MIAQASPIFSADVASSTRHLFEQDYQALANIQGDGNPSSLHRLFFGSVNGYDYQRYFDARINTIGANDCGRGGILCIIPIVSENTLYLNQSYFPGMEPRIARLAAYLSTARHDEANQSNWPYVDCPSPFIDLQGHPLMSIWRRNFNLAGSPNCDTTATGAVGVMAVFLKNISKHCTNCTYEERNYANWLADQMSYRVIDRDAYSQLLRDFAE